MIETYKISQLNKLLRKHDFKMSKSLGQNFLTDKNIIDKIADGLNLNSQDTVMEIGPGAGALTLELANRSKSVISIEIDKNLIPILDEVLVGIDNTDLVNQDFLKINIEEHVGNLPFKVAGNLPYYITTPIIMKILEGETKPEEMVFMVQKEVAQRLSASPGSKSYGSITAAANYYCHIEYLFTVSKEVFTPKPKVDSAVIRMTPYKTPVVQVEDEKIFFSIIKAGFGQRRKTLNNSLKQLGFIDASGIKIAFQQVGIDPMRRAETLSIQEFADLSNSVTSLLNNNR